MPTFSIENFGCRATEADAVALRHAMLREGWSNAGVHADAEVVILNTCTVTAAADSQSREAIRKIHRANPTARIIVTGCYAQRAPEEIAALEGVSAVVGNSRQSHIPTLARDFFPIELLGENLPRKVLQTSIATMSSSSTDAQSSAVGAAEVSPARKRWVSGPEESSPPRRAAQSSERRVTKNLREAAPIFISDIREELAVEPGVAESLEGDSTRPILKVQDGCNNRCAYCIIPSVRGRSRSLPPDRVIAAIRQYAAVGVKEVVLSGINLGSYGREFSPRVPLSALVARILDETGIEHIRFSSIEPQHITEDFISLIGSSDRIAPHFHAPLQSGSNRTLRAMRRWYRAEHYAARIELIRKMLPDAAIGADIIVGFPGETEEDFAATMEFVNKMPFTYLHVFSFSARPGTEAANLPDQVPPQLIKERARALRALGEQKSAAFRAAQSGRATRALTLARHGDDWTEALTPNYLKLRLPGLHPRNEWHAVTLGTPIA